MIIILLPFIMFLPFFIIPIAAAATHASPIGAVATTIYSTNFINGSIST